VAPPPGQQHDDINFVQPSPIQHVLDFEQLNTENPVHQPNNSNNKGKNQNNKNLGPGGNNPQQNHPARGNDNQGNLNLQGGSNNNQPQQGKTKNLKTNFPCALCGEYGHYTHHCPQIADYKQMEVSMNTQRPPATPAPQHYFQPPLSTILRNPIPHQGVMNTQQEIKSTSPQMGQYQTQVPINPKIQPIVVSSIPTKGRLFFKNTTISMACLSTLSQPPQKQIQLQQNNH
jgi:hypothetical protein